MIPQRFRIEIDYPPCTQGQQIGRPKVPAGPPRFQIRARTVTIAAATGLACLLVSGCHRQYTALPVAGAGTNVLLAAEQAEKNAYMTNFVFNHFHVERNDFGGVWEASVSFGVKNTGDRAVSGLTVTVYLVDTNGAVCHREKIVPFNNQTKAPLLPGHTWDCDINNPFIIDGVPDAWQGGYDYSQVTDMQFQP